MTEMDIFKKDVLIYLLGKSAKILHPFYKLKYHGKKNLVLNLGSGDAELGKKVLSWLGEKEFKTVNMEVNPLWKPTVWMDIRDKFPFDNGSVKTVYASHILEHLTLKDLRKVLKECSRVSREIRIAIPDLYNAIRTYVKEESYQGNKPIEYARCKSLGAQFNAMILYDNQHKIMFDYGFIMELLREVGFKNVRKFSHESGDLLVFGAKE